MKRQLEWPTAAVLIAVLITLGACVMLVDPESQSEALALVGSLGAVVLAVMRAIYQQPSKPDDDDDDDGPGTLTRFATPPRGLTNGRMHPKPDPRTVRMRSALVGFAMLLSGCGASALQTHATVASAAAMSIDTACATVQTVRAREQDEVIAHAEYREDAQSAVDGVRQRWAPAVTGCQAIAEAHSVWVDAIALAAAGAPFDLHTGLRLASGVLRVWDDLAPIFAGLGLPLPIAPVELRALTVSP